MCGQLARIQTGSTHPSFQEEEAWVDWDSNYIKKVQRSSMIWLRSGE